MKENLSVYSLILVGILALLMLIFISVEFLLPVILPFIIAWLVASVVVKPARKLSRKTGVPERILRPIMSVALTLSVAGVLGILIWQLINAIWRFLSDIGEGNRLYDMLSMLFTAEIPLIGDSIPDELTVKIREALGNIISQILSALAGWATSVVSSLPQVFFVMLVTIISLIYFSIDYDGISSFVKSLLSVRTANVIAKFRDGIFTVIKKYIISYLLILFITFIVMLAGFMILRIEHAMLIALLVAILDILPVIGVGTVLVPWSIVEISFGNSGLGIGLLVLFVTNSVIRQLAEPKIVGRNLSLHPIVTLIMLYVGYSLFGIAGLIILPVAAVSIGVVLKGDNTPKIA